MISKCASAWHRAGADLAADLLCEPELTIGLLVDGPSPAGP